MNKLIAIDMPCGDFFVNCVRAAWDAGDAVLPIDQRLPQSLKQQIIEGFGVGVVVDESGESTFNGRGIETDDALVISTSGTTGTPKGVVLTHDAMKASSEMTSLALSVDPNLDTWLCCLPVSHIGGFSVISRAIHTGTELRTHEYFDASRCEQTGRDGASLVSVVPTVLERFDTSVFRKLLVGGSAIPSSLPPNAVATYGMTETGSGIVYNGSPLEGVKIEIREGEIYVQSPSLFRTYLGQSPKVKNNWFGTGDAGYLTEAGKLVVTGRLDDAIVTGGEKVWPALIEKHLHSLGLFQEVAVIGRPSNEWGQIVTAVVILNNPNKVPPIENIREQLDPLLPRYALPKAIEVVDSLPRNIAGKILRNNI